jgi:hypothetical protein
MRRQIANVRVGEPDVAPDAPAHIPGVNSGNTLGRGDAVNPSAHGRGGTAATGRSTGINPEARNPIDSRMPNLPPA